MSRIRHRLRETAAIAVGVLTLALAFNAQAGWAASKDPCRSGRVKRASVVASSASILVLRFHNIQHAPPDYVACTRATGASYLITTGNRDVVTHIVVNGHFVAYYRITSELGTPGGSAVVEVVDPRSGLDDAAQGFEAYTGSLAVNSQDPTAFGKVTDLALSRTGGVAWISTRGPGDPNLEVRYGA